MVLKFDVASYRCGLYGSGKEAGVFPENWQEKWLSFMEQQEIVIEKKTKKSVKEVDIKPHILAWDFSMDAFAKKKW